MGGRYWRMSRAGKMLFKAAQRGMAHFEGTTVAQISNLLYRRFPIGKAKRL